MRHILVISYPQYMGSGNVLTERGLSAPVVPNEAFTSEKERLDQIPVRYEHVAC